MRQGSQETADLSGSRYCALLFFSHIILSWNCLSLIQTVMGLGIKAFFEESSKAGICLSSL